MTAAVVDEGRHGPAGAPEGLVERVRAVVPLVAERAGSAELARRPDDEVIAALEATGVFRSYVPRRFGGYEIDIDTFIDVGLAVSEACTSTGWVTSFYVEHNWILSQLPPATVEAVFSAQPYVLAPASISPTGKARAVDGGHVLDGRWAWGTGIEHADWVILNGIVAGEGLDVRLFLARRDEVEVEDTWDCAGMAATGSNDVVARQLFVPEDRSADLFAVARGRGPGADWLGSPCYRHPMLPLLAIAAAVPALGAARRAVELFRERLGGRLVYGTLTPQAEKPAAQMRLGDAAARVEAAEVVLRHVGRQLTAWGERDDECPDEERARLRVLVAQVVADSRDVVRRIMEASGASAHLRPHPMQRIHRDVHTLSCHTVFDLDLVTEAYGRLQLGMEPTSPI